MDFKRLRAFYLTIKHGSTVKAATHLKITVPTLSVQLKKLESEINAKLFYHLPNRLVLTEQGHAFFKEVSQVLESVEKAKASLSGKQETGFTGRVSVSMGSDIVKLFAPGFGSFIKQNPNLEFTLLARPAPETLSLVLAGDVDFGIGRFESVPRGLLKKHLLENAIWCAFPHKHPLSRKKTVELTDLAAFRIITLTRASGTRKAIDQVFRRSRIEPKSMLEVGSCQSAIDFVKLRVGIGLVHDICMLDEFQRKLEFQDMSHIFGKAPVILIYRPVSLLSPAHKVLVEIVSNLALKSAPKPL